MAAQVIGMHVHVARDTYGLPVVSWVEPRREYRTTLLVFSWEALPEYNARCWIDVDNRTGDFIFMLRHDGDHNKKGMPPMSGTPLSNIAGFSLHTATELYGDGVTPIPKPVQHPDATTYRDDLVLVADLKQRRGQGLPLILPLALTTAARSDVMALHATLTEVFLVNADALKPGLKKRHEQWKREYLETRWKGRVKPPILSGGRKFVNSTASQTADPSDSEIRAAIDKLPFGIFTERTQNGSHVVQYWHFFERRRNGAVERWMCGNSLQIFEPSGELCPDLICFSHKGLGRRSDAYKPRELFKGVRVFSGNELQLPPAYLAAPDVRIDASTLILCLEFADGELLPLTQAPASDRAGVERLRGQMEYVFSGMGSGGGHVVL
jgi:hypothetical protein